MTPDPDPPPPHDWAALEQAFLDRLSAEHQQAGEAALEAWRAAHANETTEWVTALVLENLGGETHLALGEKAEILKATLAQYEGTAGFDGVVVAPPITSPSEALGNACNAYLGKGARIDRDDGDLAHFMTFRKLQRCFVSFKGPTAAEVSPSGRSWRDMLLGPAFKLEPEITESLQDSVWPYFSTLGRWVDTCGRAGGSLTAQVRDRLGCPHFDREELVEFRFADSVARSECFNKPTFADAMGYPPFLPSKERDEYGFARNLGNDAEPGWPEIWHRALLANTLGIRLLEAPAEPIPAGRWAEYGARQRGA